MAIPYCNKAHAACHRCMQLSLYAESEITSLIFLMHPLPAFHHLQCVLPATESCAGAWGQATRCEQDYPTHRESESCLLMITAKK